MLNKKLPLVVLLLGVLVKKLGPVGPAPWPGVLYCSAHTQWARGVSFFVFSFFVCVHHKLQASGCNILAIKQEGVTVFLRFCSRARGPSRGQPEGRRPFSSF